MTWADVTALLSTETFWKAVAFVGVLALTFLPVYHFFVFKMSKRAQAVSNHMNEAEQLRKEANALMRSYQERNLYREDERKALVKRTSQNAHQIKIDAAVKLQERQEAKQEEVHDRVKLIRKSGLKRLKGQVLCFTVGALSVLFRKDHQMAADEAIFKSALAEAGAVLDKPSEKRKMM